MEEIVAVAGLLGAVGVGHDDLPRDHVAPARRLAGVVMEPLQQRCDVGARPEAEVFGAKRAHREASPKSAACRAVAPGTSILMGSCSLVMCMMVSFLGWWGRTVQRSS